MKFPDSNPTFMTGPPKPDHYLSDASKTELLKFLGILNLKYVLEPQIEKFLDEQNYSGLFSLYMEKGLSCLALDLAEKQLPEKRGEVMEKFPDLEEKVKAETR